MFTCTQTHVNIFVHAQHSPDWANPPSAESIIFSSQRDPSCLSSRELVTLSPLCKLASGRLGAKADSQLELAVTP